MPFSNMLIQWHLSLFRPLFMIHLLIRSLLPSNQQREISDDLQVITCTNPILRLIWSPWNQVLLVGVRC